MEISGLQRPDDYYEYENYQIEINNELLDCHELMQKIGRGKYSDVYKCINTITNKFAVVKVLKPVRQSKIKRQIKILKTLNGTPHIIPIQGVTYDPCTKTNGLIHTFVNHSDIRDLPDIQITLPRVTKYVKQILEALKMAHRASIMHRDIKPQNVLYDKETQEVYVGDWGLADFYLPKKQYNVRVASRYYKGPELLLNNKLYGFSLDIWSLGCVLAGLVIILVMKIFLKSIFFRGDSNSDQVRAIMEQVGSQQVQAYIRKYNLKPDKEVNVIMQSKKFGKKSWSSFINQNNKRLCTKQSLDLISKMLIVDHNERITAEEALKHPFFSSSV